MEDASEPQRVFPLEQIVLNQLAKKVWEKLAPEASCKYLVAYDYDTLIADKENTSTWILSGFPDLFKDLVAAALWQLNEGFKKAIEWVKIHQYNISINVLNPLADGPYNALQFINPAGQFDDLKWAKCFVIDENKDVLTRYKLACIYCLEDVCKNILYDIKSNETLYDELHNHLRYGAFGGLDKVWTLFLEKQSTEVPEDDLTRADFYTTGFHTAVDFGFERAARYFWDHYSLEEKAKFLREFLCRDLVWPAATDCVGMVYFIYSLLPISKKCFLVTHVNCVDCSIIWRSLIRCSSWNSVLSEVLELPVSLSSKFYGKMFTELVNYMGAPTSESKLRRKMFMVIWNRVADEGKQLEVLPEIAESVLPWLTNNLAFDLLAMIIQPLPHPEKDKILFQILPSCYKLFINIDDFALSVQYFFPYIIDQNPITKMLRLRTDASLLLHNFAKISLRFWPYNDPYKPSRRRPLEEFMECLQGSLEALSQICNQIDDMHLSDFGI